MDERIKEREVNIRDMYNELLVCFNNKKKVD